MKTHFIRKAMDYELIPQDEFIIEKEVILVRREFDEFIKRPLNDYYFIEENIDTMYVDEGGISHCIFVTSDEHDFGILVESEGYKYARYTAYLTKNNLKG